MSLDDRLAEERRRNNLIDSIDAELREMETEEYKAEHAAWLARREKWENLPRYGMRPGVPAHRLTEAEAEILDREGY